MKAFLKNFSYGALILGIGIGLGLMAGFVLGMMTLFGMLWHV